MKPYTKARRAYIKSCHLSIEEKKLYKRLRQIKKEQRIAVQIYFDYERENPDQKRFYQEHIEYLQSLKQKNETII